MKQILFGLVAVATFSVVYCTGVAPPPSITTTLTCHDVNEQESIPRVPYGRVVIQEGARIYLPYDNPELQLPNRGVPIDVNALITFLGSDYNSDLTSPTLPTTDPPNACNLLPVFNATSGVQTDVLHVEEVNEPIPLFTDRENSDTWYELGNRNASEILNVSIPAQRNDSTTNTRKVFNPEVFGGFNFGQFYRQYLNDIDEMSDLWIAKCPVRPVWAKLPPRFFPRYYAQGSCSGKNCSYPRGLNCIEDIKYSVYVTVLHWGCCFNTIYRQTRRECGWRKVLIPILCECSCECDPNSSALAG